MTDAGIPMGEGREQRARAVLKEERQSWASPVGLLLRKAGLNDQAVPTETAIRAMLAFADTPPPAAAGDREAAIGAAYTAIYGPEMDPFQHPEGWEYAATIADAILALRTPKPNSGGEASDG